MDGPLAPITPYSQRPPPRTASMKASPNARAMMTACNTNALASARREPPSARAIADEMPPPMAPADIICISIRTGKTRATPARESVPSLPMKYVSTRPAEACAPSTRMLGTASRSSVRAIGASINTRVRGSIPSLPGEKKSPGHGARRAHADQPVAGVATRHLIGERGQDPSARCRPRMPDGDRASIHVDPIPVHRIGGGTFPAFLPRCGVCQHLGGERFVDFDQIDVLEPQTYALEQSRHRDSWCHEQPLLRMKRGIFHGLDEGQGRPALLTRALLAHQQYGGCPVGDRRRIAGSDRSVGTECRLQRGESFERGIGPRAGVAGYAVERQNLLSEALARRHRVAVAGEGNLILARSRDAPLLARDLGVLAHGETSARLVERARVGSAQPLDAAGNAGADPPI